MDSFSLYLHIPFCQHRCSYCDFNTYAGIDNLIPNYVQALCQEIQIIADGAGRRLPVRTIFFGGGTPSLLPIRELEKILKAIEVAYQLQPGVEITLEANPGTLSPGFLRDLVRLNVNRISLGMQSALSNELLLLERQHNLGDVQKAVDWARQAGLGNLNLDLIFGIPYQSLESWKNTLAMALSMQPDHLSLYALTLEHGTPLAHWVGRGLVSQADNDLAADMYELATERLDQAGYLPYEISNWARIDPLRGVLTCKHNLQYWRSLPYLGFGAGAHGWARGIRTMNVLSPAVYIQRLNQVKGSENESFSPPFPRGPANSEYIEVDPQASMGEYMMMGLRLVQEGVSQADFRSRFGKTLQDAYGIEIEKMTRVGLLEWLEDRQLLRLTKRGRLLGNIVFAEFI